MNETRRPAGRLATTRARATVAAVVDAPPQDEQAEESVLGAMLLAPEAIDAVRPIVASDDFYRDSHGRIFRVAVEMHALRDPVDAITLADELTRRGFIEQIGGRVRIRELAALVPATANAPHYARIVRRLAAERRLREAFAADPLDTARIVRLAGELERVGTDESEAGWLETAVELLDEPDPGPTPFAVDALLVDGAIGMLVGPPKIGKTWLVLELALSIVTGRPAFERYAVPTRGPAMVIVEESGRTALHRRLDALARGRAIGRDELADLHVAANRRVRLDEPDWRRRLLAAAARIEPRAIFLDPLVRLKGAGVDENVQREIGPVLDFIRDLRDESGAAVVFTHHTGHDGVRARGSSDLEAYWESRLTLACEERPPGVRKLAAEHREAEPSPRLAYRLASDAATRSVRLALVERTEAAERTRDLVEDVFRFVSEHPGATGLQIRHGVTGRDEEIVTVLRDSGRFRSESGPRNAEHWFTVHDLFPAAGNGSEQVSRAPVGGAVPPAPSPPKGEGPGTARRRAVPAEPEQDDAEQPV